MNRQSLVKIGAILYLLLFLYLAFDPHDRAVWAVENIPVVVVFGYLVLTYKKFAFSFGSYVMMSIWLVLHTIGGHFTFANVPFDFINHLFGFERNNFDRFAHFSVGFFAYPIVEYVLRKRLTNSYRFAMHVGFSTIMAVAALYEINEWAVAVLSGGSDVGLEYLGVQGDVWDAQKDMCCDGMGALTALLIYSFVRPDKNYANELTKDS